MKISATGLVLAVLAAVAAWMLYQRRAAIGGAGMSRPTMLKAADPEAMPMAPAGTKTKTKKKKPKKVLGLSKNKWKAGGQGAAAGAAAGSAAGPYGAAVGAGVGFASAVFR